MVLSPFTFTLLRYDESAYPRGDAFSCELLGAVRIGLHVPIVIASRVALYVGARSTMHYELHLVERSAPIGTAVDIPDHHLFQGVRRDVDTRAKRRSHRVAPARQHFAELSTHEARGSSHKNAGHALLGQMSLRWATDAPFPGKITDREQIQAR